MSPPPQIGISYEIRIFRHRISALSSRSTKKTLSWMILINWTWTVLSYVCFRFGDDGKTRAFLGRSCSDISSINGISSAFTDLPYSWSTPRPGRRCSRRANDFLVITAAEPTDNFCGGGGIRNTLSQPEICRFYPKGHREDQTRSPFENHFYPNTINALLLRLFMGYWTVQKPNVARTYQGFHQNEHVQTTKKIAKSAQHKRKLFSCVFLSCVRRRKQRET